MIWSTKFFCTSFFSRSIDDSRIERTNFVDFHHWLKFFSDRSIDLQMSPRDQREEFFVFVIHFFLFNYDFLHLQKRKKNIEKIESKWRKVSRHVSFLYVRIDERIWRRFALTFGFVTKTLLFNSAFWAISLKFAFDSRKYSRRSWDDLAKVRD